MTRLSTVAFALLFACGCGTFEKKGASSSPSSAPSPMPLDGTWTLNCDSSGEKMVLIFSGLSVMKHTYFYADSDTTCAGSSVSVQTTNMTLTYGQPVVNIQNAQNMNVTIVSSTMVLTAQSVVDYLNTQGNSAYTDWKLDTPKDNTGKGNVSAKGTVSYTIFKIDGGKLYTGDYDTGDGTSDAKRPIALDMKDFYTKQ